MKTQLYAALAGLAGACLLSAVPFAAAAQDIDPAQLQQGQAIFESNCATCHQIDGSGSPPDFPALAGNANLEQLELIVGNVHNGKGAMPPFPDLSAEDIAAVATYVRNSWGNAFGPASVDEVTTILADLGAAAGDTSASAAAAGTATAGATIWSGVFTEEQAARGEEYYSGVCAKCHGGRLNGAAEPDQPPSPAIARSGFIARWAGSPLASLYTYIHSNMPLDNPGQLTEEQTADVLAYMLSVSGAEPGETELPADTDALAGIAIEEKPE